MSRFTLRVVLGISLALVLIAGAAGALVWWKIASLKEQLVRSLGNAIGAQVEISSIDLDVWKGEFHAAGISLTNQRPSAPWDKGSISQAALRFHFRDIFAPTLPVSVEVSSWSVILHSPLRTAETPLSDASGEPASAPAMGRIQVTEISARQGSVEIDFSDDRKISLTGVEFHATNNGAGGWATKFQAGSLTAGPFQASEIDAMILGQPDKLRFTDLHMQCGSGAVTGSGDVAPGGNHEAHINLKAVDVPVTMLLAIEWQMKLSGLATGDLSYTGNDQGGSGTGQLALNHGKFNLLPWLGKVTALVGLQDISDVEVDRATGDFAWKDGMFHLTHLDVRKNDVTRITGDVDVDAKGQVDGRLKFGLPSTVTAKWPQLQEKVFPVQLEDYNWADVHLTGTPDHLQEDLTPRLLAAGLGQGTDLLNQATQKASDLFNNLLGK